MQRPISELRRKLFYLWNFYPPFLGAGIRITKVAKDCSSVEMKLTLRSWNQNYIGSIFGGSMYMMCDPIHMVLLIMHLGESYIVRDKGAEIKFLKKAYGTVRVKFSVSDQELDAIRNDPQDVQERKYLAQIFNDKKEVVAEVTKILHIRRKN